MVLFVFFKVFNLNEPTRPNEQRNIKINLSWNELSRASFGVHAPGRFKLGQRDRQKTPRNLTHTRTHTHTQTHTLKYKPETQGLICLVGQDKMSIHYRITPPNTHTHTLPTPSTPQWWQPAHGS